MFSMAMRFMTIFAFPIVAYGANCKAIRRTNCLRGLGIHFFDLSQDPVMAERPQLH